jgi:hypothetical protein
MLPVLLISRARISNLYGTTEQQKSEIDDGNSHQRGELHQYQQSQYLLLQLRSLAPIETLARRRY